MQYEDLTPEQRERARACGSLEELLALAKELGYELSEGELAQVSAGGNWLCSDECMDDCLWLCNMLNCSADNY